MAHALSEEPAAGKPPRVAPDTAREGLARADTAETAGLALGPITEEDAVEPAKVVQDSKWKAIFFMNLFALSATVQGALFKYVAKEGVSVIEFCFFRNLWIGGLATV